jgi:hypothetical protein
MTGIFPESFLAIATANALGTYLILVTPEEAVLADLDLED